jgi:hypothetical protein
MMRVKDFIEALRRGELTQNDIEVEARKYPNVIALVEDLWLEDIVEENRHLSEAIDIIRLRVMEPQQLEVYDVFKPRYSVIAQMLNNLQSDGVIEYVKKQIEDYPALLGDGIGFVNYVYKQLSECADLNIYGRGSKLLDRGEAGNIFELLKQLEYDLSKIDKNRCVEPQQGSDTSKESEPIFPSEFDTPEAKSMFDEMVKMKYCKRVGTVYQWTNTNALFGYMVLKTSDKLNIRYDNNRLPWGIYQRAFGMNDTQIRTAKNVVSNVQAQRQNEPTGYDKIDRLCK